MGPNGSGKTTLCHVLTGKSGYRVSGEAFLEGHSLLEMEVDERSRLGLMQSFQYPTEVPGVSLRDFLAEAAEERGLTEEEAEGRIEAEAARFDMTRFLDRSLNNDLSGGEKKRSEIFQRLPVVSEPKEAMISPFWAMSRAEASAVPRR